ncbi:uncharacterized protein EI97DRAFT_43682 [Westerdykella ornata]|uniref:Uncharacterized protein n=1 Tax=Westerdykella ornata TaxID=318751 RepID=A0A6A6JLL7_WESOR|nr:uncharacterized protein EI97DRAFT_43682 [Westerdykella ornata]KAF2276546.1 hypothetical protein EI97DRAFT_43682 [Westerdykella ornata]
MVVLVVVLLSCCIDVVMCMDESVCPSLVWCPLWRWGGVKGFSHKNLVDGNRGKGVSSGMAWLSVGGRGPGWSLLGYFNPFWGYSLWSYLLSTCSCGNMHPHEGCFWICALDVSVASVVIYGVVWTTLVSPCISMVLQMVYRYFNCFYIEPLLLVVRYFHGYTRKPLNRTTEPLPSHPTNPPFSTAHKKLVAAMPGGQK